MMKFLATALFGSAALSGGLLIRYAEEQVVTPHLAQVALDSSTVAIRQPAESITLAERNSSTPQTKAHTLLFVGDIMLSRTVEKEIREHRDYAYPFRLIYETIQSADLTFGNLENPISSRGTNQGSKYSFRAKPEVIEGLTIAGFDVLSLANNHILDWGRMALEDTLSLLKENNIVSIGAGKNYAEANAPKILAIGEKNSTLRIAFLAYTNLYPENFEAGEKSGISNLDISLISEAIRAIRNRNEADIIVVSLHWGEEYKPHPTEAQRETAHALVDAGADLIIGHHSHVVQDVEQYNEGWIFYSLGNFVFDQYFSPETMRGLMARIVVRDRKIERVEQVPVLLNDTFQPAVAVP